MASIDYLPATGYQGLEGYHGFSGYPAPAVSYCSGTSRVFPESYQSPSNLVVVSSKVVKKVTPPPPYVAPKTFTQEVEEKYGVKFSRSIEPNTFAKFADYTPEAALKHNFYTIEEYKILLNEFSLRGETEKCEAIFKIIEYDIHSRAAISLWQRFIDFLITALRRWTN